MDLASIIGMIGAFGLMIMGMVIGDAGFAALKGFLDAPSAAITFGGALLATLMGTQSIPAFINGLKSFTLIFKPFAANEEEIIKTIINLSTVARKEGLLSLEEAANSMDNEFLKKGILLIVDGTDPELVRAIMETELVSTEERHKKNINFWSDLGAMGPAWGMIGTLIGLVNMLYNMSDAASIGPAMAVALLTTMYGSLIANWICLPATFKMKKNNAAETMVKEIMIEGLLSIQAGENPRVIEEKLKSFLSPKDRAAATPESSGEE